MTSDTRQGVILTIPKIIPIATACDLLEKKTGVSWLFELKEAIKNMKIKSKDFDDIKFNILNTRSLREWSGNLVSSTHYVTEETLINTSSLNQYLQSNYKFKLDDCSFCIPNVITIEIACNLLKQKTSCLWFSEIKEAIKNQSINALEFPNYFKKSIISGCVYYEESYINDKIEKFYGISPDCVTENTNIYTDSINEYLKSNYNFNLYDCLTIFSDKINIQQSNTEKSNLPTQSQREQVLIELLNELKTKQPELDFMKLGIFYSTTDLNKLLREASKLFEGQSPATFKTFWRQQKICRFR